MTNTQPSPNIAPSDDRANPADAASEIFQLRPDLRIIPQQAGRLWSSRRVCRYILEDPKTKKFYRIGRREYLVISCMKSGLSLPEALSSLKDSNPSLEISKTFVESLMKWLAQAGLVIQPASKDSSVPLTKTNGTVEFEGGAGEESERHELLQGLDQHLLQQESLRRASDSPVPIDPFGFRIPILDGEKITQFARYFSPLAHPIAWVASFLLVVWAALAFIANPSFYTGVAGQLFVPEAALWWLAAWITLKTAHEFGHAVVCLHHGGEIRRAGLAFFFFAPVPYVDTTDMWRLSSRWSRFACAGGGIYFELTLASIATLLCSQIEIPTLQYYLISLAMLGTFTTVAFNANPLIRFDGYYLLSDLLDRPNLWTEAQTAFKETIQRKAPTVAGDRPWERLGLTTYGFLCVLNRISILGGLAWGAWMAWQGIGLCLIAFGAYLWFVVPHVRNRRIQMCRAGSSVTFSQSFLILLGESLSHLIRFRFWFGVAKVSLVLGMATFLAVVLPSPFQPFSPGVVVYSDPLSVRPLSDGFLSEVYVRDGQKVRTGDPIALLSNPKLTFDVKRLETEVDGIREKCHVLRATGKSSELKAELAHLEIQLEELRKAKELDDSLVLIAGGDGKFVSRQLSGLKGKYIQAGENLGLILPNERIEVHGSVSQTEIDAFRRGGNSAIVAVRLGKGRTIQGRVREIDPVATDQPEHATLLAKYGGPLPAHLVHQGHGKEPVLKTERSRFRVRIELDADANLRAIPGERCLVRLQTWETSISDVLYRWTKAIVDHVTRRQP